MKDTPKDRLERRSYRKSPGRQYGYDYDPLRSRSGQASNSTQNTRGREEMMSNAGSLLSQRPDPRRTRQLLRQNILASKMHPMDEDERGELREIERGAPRQRQAAQSYIPTTRELMKAGDEQWSDFEDIDRDLDYEDPLDVRLGYAASRPARSSTAPRSPMPHILQEAPSRASGRLPVNMQEQEFEDDNYDDDEEEDERSQGHRKPKKQKMSRRGLLVGLGLAAVSGTGLAAYELAPKIPQALGNVGADIEHQVQDAFNRGLAQGADNVRREFVTALDSLEGFSLGGAITAARLTRVAYDVFVSPVIKVGATVTGDVLTGMLRAFKTARGFLIGANLDNATLGAIQKVLETWVAQVSTLPEQLNAITQTDLDGAQAYLRALQRKIDDEKAKLNNPPPVSQSTSKPKP